MTALDPRALEAALLPCPFCGGTMQLRFALWPAEGDRDAVIHAAPTNCPIEGAFCIDTDDDGVSVAEAWNRRATLPAAPATGSVGEDATLTFANGEAYGLTMDQGRRAIAAALQADTIPSAIDGAIKGMRVLRTMLNSRGLGGADVAEAIIADLERMNADPAAVPAPPVQEPVAFDVERFLQDDSGLPPFASPSPLSAQEDGWQPIETANKVVDETVLLRIEHPHYAIAPPEDRHLWETITTAHWTDFNKGGWVWYGLAGSPTHWRHLPAPPQPQEMKP